MEVSLREIDARTVRQITALAVAAEQRHFVADNATSLAEALFNPEAWYRAVYVDESPAGFAMLRDESLRPTPPLLPQISLWRFMIDARCQRQRIGGEALRLVIAHVRAKAIFARLLLSYVPGAGCAEPFYRRAGFVPTGRIAAGEVETALSLADDLA